MRSKIKVLGHPLHPMLIVFPLGLLATSFVFDIIYLIVSDGRTLAAASFYMIVAGVVGGLIAAIFGTLDWLAIPKGTRAWQIGLLHGVGNGIVTLLFLISAVARYAIGWADPGVGPIVLSFFGLLCALVTGWLGGELVYRLNIGPDEGANANAPSSLLSESARGATSTQVSAGEPATRTSFPGR